MEEPCGKAPFLESSLPPSGENCSNFFPNGSAFDDGPECAHQWKCDEAVTTVAHDQSFLFAGTVSGALLTFDLQTYQLVNREEAHSSSILTLLCEGGLLFTGSADSLIKVWVPGAEPQFLHTVYALTDIGDVFSLAYWPQHAMLYIGTQNASLHWVKLDEARQQTEQRHSNMPAVRPSRFFDSTGPGGQIAPQQQMARLMAEQSKVDELVEIPLDNTIAFAHFSAVFAMVLDVRRELLVTGSGDGDVKMWRVSQRGVPVLAHTLHVGDAVFSLALASSWQLCCGLDSQIVLVDLDTLQLLRHNVAPATNADSPPIIALAATEDVVFAAGGTGIAAIGSAAAETRYWHCPGDVTAITTLPGRSLGGQLATSSADGSIILWDVALKNCEDACASGDALGDDALVQFLAQLVRFQTVSGRDRTHWSDARRCATLLRDHMRLLGAQADLCRVEDGNPIVFARFTPQDDPTVPASARRPSTSSLTASPLTASSSPPSTLNRILFYGHYDVIEAQRDRWDVPPFQLTSRDGYLYGRGVTDDKGPCAAALFAVARLFAAGRLRSEVVFLIEGEEESGSFGFMETAKRLGVGPIDWIIFSNSLWLEETRPCLNYGLRGVIFLEIEVTSGKRDVHSGVEGGLFREPAKDMINLLAKLTDEQTGQIAIPGFADCVLPLTAQEEKLYDDIVATTGIARDDLIHRWRLPSYTVHKFEVSGPHNQTVIPANVKAYVSLRLVPSQTASGVTEKLQRYLTSEFVKFNSPNRVSTRVKYEADPWLGDPSNELFTCMRDAVEKVWGEPPLFIREGGSIPVARALEKMFDAPAAQLPCGQSSDGAHLNNERMRTTNLFNARRVFEEVFEHLGRRKR